MKVVKYSLVFLFFLFVFSVLPTVQGQERYVMNLQGYNEQPYHFGFILGGNQMLFDLKTIDNLSSKVWTTDQLPDFNAHSAQVYSVTVQGAPGFSVGILGNLLLNKYVDLRFIPTLSFGSRSLQYKIRAQGLNGGNIDSTIIITKQLNSTYLTFPLIFKYRSWRQNNVGGYFLGGASLSIDMAAAKQSKLNDNIGIIKLHPHDLSLQAGAGFDFYNKYFKLGIEAKMIYGLKNLIIRENDIYSGSISQLHSKIFMLTFTFE
ncbi:MAG: PorT family protein [Bacteroidales bacterium]|nr:PorT family protein [Bacteroidales bacterium]